jgi:hypothetical protein
MLPLRKKKADAAGQAAMPAWHPNFRNVERLPDTKVVRTAFFVNGVAIVCALVAAGWFAYQEYELHSLHRQIAQAQEQIDRDRKPSDQAVALYKKFQAEAGRITEIDAFLKERPAPSDLLMHLAATLPANLAFDSFELRETGMRLAIAIRGAPDRASGYASAYVDQLRNDPQLSGRFTDIALTNLARNPQTGRLTVEVMLNFKGLPPPKKK